MPHRYCSNDALPTKVDLFSVPQPANNQSAGTCYHLHAARSKPVEVGRDSYEIRALVADVVPAHVVDHDHEHVRLGVARRPLLALRGSTVAIPAYASLTRQRRLRLVRAVAGRDAIVPTTRGGGGVRNDPFLRFVSVYLNVYWSFDGRGEEGTGKAGGVNTCTSFTENQ